MLHMRRELCRGTARRDRSCYVSLDTKMGKWQRSHNSVFMCCGFIFIFFALVMIVSYLFEPSILMFGEEPGKQISGMHPNDLSMATPGISARQNIRILTAGGLVSKTTTLQLQQDVLEQHRLGSEPKHVRKELQRPEVDQHVSIQVEGSDPLGLAAGLRIYIYDLPSEYNSDWLNDSRCSTHLFAAEVALHQILLESPMRTMDPGAADFFFVAVYVSCNFRPKNGLPSMTNATVMIRAAVDLISRDMAYWNRSRGSDHVFVASHDYGACFHAVEELAVAAGLPDFLRKSIILQTFGQKGAHPCQEVENIQIPPYVDPEAVQKHWKPVELQERKIWAYFRGKLELHPKNVGGNIYSRGVRTRLWQKFRKNERFFLQRKRNDDYQSEMLNSTFCLAPLGWAPWSPRIVESVVYGCIPVLIADNIALPYSHVIDWPSISLTVGEKDVDKLDEILRHVVATNLTTIQQNLWKEEYRHALIYTRPLRRGDASWHVFDLLAKKKLRLQSQNRRSISGI